MDIPMGVEGGVWHTNAVPGNTIVSQERCRCSSIRLSSQIVRLNRERNENHRKKKEKSNVNQIADEST